MVKTKRITEEISKRITELDIGACQYALGLIASGLPFKNALEAAEKYRFLQNEKE